MLDTLKASQKLVLSSYSQVNYDSRLVLLQIISVREGMIIDEKFSVITTVVS